MSIIYICEKNTQNQDTARYYRPGGVKVVGAHWERSFLTILSQLETSPGGPYREILNPDSTNPIIIKYKDASTINCLYLGEGDKELMKGTVFANKSAGLDFSIFEQLEKIRTISSRPVSERVVK